MFRLAPGAVAPAQLTSGLSTPASIGFPTIPLQGQGNNLPGLPPLPLTVFQLSCSNPGTGAATRAARR